MADFRICKVYYRKGQYFDHETFEMPWTASAEKIADEAEEVCKELKVRPFLATKLAPANREVFVISWK